MNSTFIFSAATDGAARSARAASAREQRDMTAPGELLVLVGRQLDLRGLRDFDAGHAVHFLHLAVRTDELVLEVRRGIVDARLLQIGRTVLVDDHREVLLVL